MTPLNSLVAKHFDIPSDLTGPQLRDALVKTFEYLIEDDFPKLLQILYRADVDQHKLRELLENAEGTSAAEVIADAYLARQRAKIVMWEKYSKTNTAT